MKLRATLLSSALFLLGTAATPAAGFVCLSPSGGIQGDPAFCTRWTNGFARMTTLLGSSGGQLFNGTFTWDSNVQGAALDWNTTNSGFQFQVVGGEFIDPCGRQGAGHACTDTGPEGDNPIFFTDTICGAGFGDIIAQTTNCFTPRTTQSRMVNSPVFFNARERWNAYDGPLRNDGIIDIRRVILHELGHVLGLVHPDDNGQFVTAIMNRRVSNLDRLRDDDIAGAFFLYRNGVPGDGPPPGAVSSCHIAATDSGGAAWLALLAGVGVIARRVPAQLARRREQQA